MESITDTILVAVIAAIPGLVMGVWAWFKAHAASTPAKWDDRVVGAIEGIAEKIVERKTP